MQQQKLELIYLAPAREELLEIGRYHLQKVGPQSVRRITDSLLKQIDQLPQFPLMGPSHPDPVLAANGYRKLVLKHPYVCVYKVFPDGIYIYRIVNGAADYPKLLT